MCSVLGHSGGLCLTLRPHGLWPPGSSVHGILQAGALEWAAVPSSGVFMTQEMNPRFFCLWADLGKPMANPRSSYLQWSGNDGGGRSGLCAMVSGCTATSEAGWGMRRYPAFLGSPSDWHHYAVVWDENGVFGTSSVIAVYVDGKLVPTDGRNGLGLGRKFKSFLEGPVLLGFPQRENEREPAARHVPFLIDDFKIWSGPKVPDGRP